MDEPLYRIGEAARLLELETYVLRFWETEFPQLQPLRTPKGQRKYTQKHLELLKLVKHLLHHQGMTIEGARKILANSSNLTNLPNLPNLPNLAQTADAFTAQDAINAAMEATGSAESAGQINQNTQLTQIADGTQIDYTNILTALPTAQTSLPAMAQPDRQSKTQVKLVQGSLVPPGMLQPPSKDRKLLQTLRHDLQALRDTLRTLTTEPQDH